MFRSVVAENIHDNFKGVQVPCLRHSPCAANHPFAQKHQKPLCHAQTESAVFVHNFFCCTDIHSHTLQMLK